MPSATSFPSETREKERGINVVVIDYGSHKTNKKVQNPVVIKSCTGNSFKALSSVGSCSAKDEFFFQIVKHAFRSKNKWQPKFLIFFFSKILKSPPECIIS
jgi:hypothetical protein